MAIARTSLHSRPNLPSLRSVLAFKNTQIPSFFYLPSLDRMIAVVVAFLLFSPFGWKAFLNIGGNYFPEPVLALVCIMPFVGPRFWKKSISTLGSSKLFWVWTGICVFLLVLGVAVQRDFIASYTDFRCTLILGTSYCLIAEAKGARTESLSICVNLSVFTIFFNVIAFFLLPQAEGSAKFSYPVGCVLFLIAIWGVPFRSPVKIIIIMGVMGLMALTGFFRVNYIILAFVGLITVVCLVRAILVGSLRNKLTSAALLVVSVVLPLIFFSGGSNFVVDFLSADDARYAQSIGKIENTLLFFQTGEIGDGDDTRLLYFDYIADNLPAFMLPSGFGSRNNSFNYGPAWTENRFLYGSSLDGMHLFLLAHFGLILGVIVFGFVANKVFHGVRMLSTEDRFTYVLVWLALAAYSTATGAMFVQTSIAFSIGITLGILAMPLYRIGASAALNGSSPVPTSRTAGMVVSASLKARPISPIRWDGH